MRIKAILFPQTESSVQSASTSHEAPPPQSSQSSTSNERQPLQVQIPADHPVNHNQPINSQHSPPKTFPWAENGSHDFFLANEDGPLSEPSVCSWQNVKKTELERFGGGGSPKRIKDADKYSTLAINGQGNDHDKWNTVASETVNGPVNGFGPSTSKTDDRTAQTNGEVGLTADKKGGKVAVANGGARPGGTVWSFPECATYPLFLASGKVVKSDPRLNPQILSKAQQYIRSFKMGNRMADKKMVDQNLEDSDSGRSSTDDEEYDSSSTLSGYRYTRPPIGRFANRGLRGRNSMTGRPGLFRNSYRGVPEPHPSTPSVTLKDIVESLQLLKYGGEMGPTEEYAKKILNQSAAQNSAGAPPNTVLFDDSRLMDKQENNGEEQMMKTGPETPSSDFGNEMVGSNDSESIMGEGSKNIGEETFDLEESAAPRPVTPSSPSNFSIISDQNPAIDAAHAIAQSIHHTKEDDRSVTPPISGGLSVENAGIQEEKMDIVESSSESDNRGNSKELQSVKMFSWNDAVEKGSEADSRPLWIRKYEEKLLKYRKSEEISVDDSLPLEDSLQKDKKRLKNDIMDEKAQDQEFIEKEPEKEPIFFRLSAEELSEIDDLGEPRICRIMDDQKSPEENELKNRSTMNFSVGKTPDWLLGERDGSGWQEKSLENLRERIASRKRKRRGTVSLKFGTDSGFIKMRRIDGKQSNIESKTYLQEAGASCRLLAPLGLSKCRDCQKVDSESDHTWCQFVGYRRIICTETGPETYGWLTAEETDILSLRKVYWMSSSQQEISHWTQIQACYILQNLGKHLEAILDNEYWLLRCLQYNKSDNLNRMPAFRHSVQVREMCDVCATTIFNLHLMCGTCGFIVCIDCTRDRNLGGLRLDNKKRLFDLDKHGWPNCRQRRKVHGGPEGESHAPQHLVLAQKIPDPEPFYLSTVMTVEREMQQSMEKHRVALECVCPSEAVDGGKNKGGEDRHLRCYCAKKPASPSAVSRVVSVHEEHCSPSIHRRAESSAFDVAETERNEAKEGCMVVEGTYGAIKAPIEGQKHGEIVENEDKQENFGKEDESKSATLIEDGLNKTKELTETEKPSLYDGSSMKEELTETFTKERTNGATEEQPVSDAPSANLLKASASGESIKKTEHQSFDGNIFNDDRSGTEIMNGGSPERRELPEKPSAPFFPAEIGYMCEGGVLVLENPDNGKGNLHAFQRHWKQSKPVIVGNIQKRLNSAIWCPEYFRDIKARFEKRNITGLIIDCRSGAAVSHGDVSVDEFWEGFSDSQKYPMSKYTGTTMYLKLKDYPGKATFKEALPEHYQEFCRCLPLPEYTAPEMDASGRGIYNLVTSLPSKLYVRPDLGPKMYTAYGMLFDSKKASTCLHLDISDAVNVMVNVTVPKGYPEDYLKNAMLKLCKDEGVNDADMKRVERNWKEAGAIWTIFLPEDSYMIKHWIFECKSKAKFVQELPKDLQDQMKNAKVDDPIHDQTFFLTGDLQKELRRWSSGPQVDGKVIPDSELEGVRGFTFVQMLGDAVFIPAGAAHQVQNLLSCIKVAEDFVTPEGVTNSALVANEFRHLTREHANREDKLQLKNIVYHAILESIGALEKREKQA